MASPSSQDRLRPGQEARTPAGGLTVLTGGVTGSVLPPGVHQFSDAEYATGGFWLSGDSTGAYIYRFPYAMSNYDQTTVMVPPPPDPGWGVAAHYWLFRSLGPGLDADAGLHDTLGDDAHSWRDPRDVEHPTSTSEMIISGHFGGWGTLDTVYVVVEVDPEHPKPAGATIDLSELLTVLDTLIVAPTVYSNTLTATYTPAGADGPETVSGYNATFVPSSTGALMSVQGNQFTNPITVTIDDVAATGVHILEYETDTQEDGGNGFIDTPGRLQFFAPPQPPAANDDDYRTVTFSTVHGDSSGLQLTYVDPALFTQISAVGPGTIVTDGTATITITGVNFEENGFWIAFWTDEQAGPDNAGVSFGSGLVTSLTGTAVVLAYPFTDGDATTYTLEPGTYHVSVAGTYYRFSDATDVILTVEAG